MRNASFIYTEQQVLDEIKDVTRRTGWEWAKPGMRVQAVRKSMGRKKGEAVVKLKVIEIVSVRREPLNALVDRSKYTVDQAYAEIRREGFEHHPEVKGSPFCFIEMFCRHMKCLPGDIVTRIEFKYVKE